MRKVLLFSLVLTLSTTAYAYGPLDSGVGIESPNE